MIQFEFEIELLELFVLKLGRVPPGNAFLLNPGELVALVQLANFNTVGQRLASRHEVSIIFFIARAKIVFVKRVIVGGPHATDQPHLHLDIFLDDFSLFAHLEGIDGDGGASPAGNLVVAVHHGFGTRVRIR